MSHPAVFEKPVIHGEIDLAGLLRTLWRGRWVILGSTVLCVLLTSFVCWRLPDVYRATVTLVPSENLARSAVSGIAGQVSGLAALAGMDFLQGRGGDKANAGVVLLKSWGLQEEFIRRGRYEVPVLAARGWDPKSGKLLIDPSIYDEGSKSWGRKVRRSPENEAQPSGWALHKRFSKRLLIRKDDDTGFYTLSVDFYSPVLAKKWAEQLVQFVNQKVREKDRLEFSRNVAYLQESLARTQLTEMKLVLSKLIEEQTKNLMLADVNEEYVFKVLSPAKKSEEPIAPRRLLIVALAAVVSLLGSMLAWCLYLNLRE